MFTSDYSRFDLLSLRADKQEPAVIGLADLQNPQMQVCILLADHFGVNPNEILHLAGWPTLKAFDVRVLDAVNLPPEATEVALAIARISEPDVRREVTDAGVAEAIGKTLAECGSQVDVLSMAEVVDLTPYRAVVAGSAIQGQKWLPEAMRYMKKHQAALALRPSWSISLFR